MTENQSNANQTGGRGWGPVCEDNYLRKRLIGFAWRWLPEGEKDYAEDIVQEAYVRVFLYKDSSQVEDPANYLLKVVQRLSFDRSASPSRLTAANTVRLDALLNDENEEAFMELKDPGRGPELDAIANIGNDRLMAEIEAQSEDLTEREQHLLGWHLAGLSNEQIAHVMGEGIEVVKTDMNKVMAKMRYRLKHPKEGRNPRKTKGESQS